MLLKTILNKCYKFKSFVYGNIRFNENEIEVDIMARKNGTPICSECGAIAHGYDTLKPRRFEFIPIWNIKVYFVYAMRRVQCGQCGVTVEQVPWAIGKRTLTIPFMLFLANWAKALSWQETADRFRVSWEKVFHAVEYAVRWGLANRDLSNIKAIGIDEVAWRKGHEYLTLVYQINSECKRLLWIGKDRCVRTLLGFFHMFGKARSAALEYVCSDMWKPYLKVIKKKATGALHILDRFHIVQKINKAVDEVRAAEHRLMKQNGHEVLKHTRWCLLKRRENLTPAQEVRLRDLLRYNLKSVRAYLLKEDFQGLWTYVSPWWAGKFIDRWTERVMRSRLSPLKTIAKTIRNHKQLILNWFKAKGAISTGVVEGFNNKVKVTTRKSYGFRTFKCAEIALYHVLGDLPDQKLTHSFY